jgi:hypothetical protein
VSWVWLTFDPCIAVWPAHGDPPHRGALRAAAGIADPAGAPCEVSLVRVPDGVRVPMDDLMVQQARRDVLAARPFDGLTTLLSDDSRFEGALTVARGAQVQRLGEDPFGRLFGALRLSVPAGVLGTMPAPAGPVIERYGSANPWPCGRFD